MSVKLLPRAHRIGWLLLVTLALCTPPLPAAEDSAPPRLTSDTNTATAGYFQLQWTTPAPSVELQESADLAFPDARTIYSGSDHSALLSGKPDGQWYYRIRAVNGERLSDWSQPVEVTVAHHPLGRAAGFFLLGLAVFIATSAMIIRGDRHPT